MVCSTGEITSTKWNYVAHTDCENGVYGGTHVQEIITIYPHLICFSTILRHFVPGIAILCCIIALRGIAE